MKAIDVISFHLLFNNIATTKATENTKDSPRYYTAIDVMSKGGAKPQ